MRTLQIIVLTILIGGSTIAQNQKNRTASLTIEVSGIKNTEGTLRFFLFTSEDDFLKQPFLQKTTKAESNSITFDDLPLGTYAVNIYHDKNNNGELDTNLFGVPKEAYGFSNNIRGKFGPPEFNQVQITITKPENIKINLK